MDQRARRKTDSTAFTLIEMLVVIAVLGILIGITLVVARSVEDKASINRAKSELALIAHALEQYKTQYGDYPWVTGVSDATQRRQTLYRALSGTQGPQGDPITAARVFIEHERFELSNPRDLDATDNHLLDPWGNAYEYYYKDKNSGTSGNWENSSYVLFSKGPDGASKAGDPGPDGWPDYENAANLDNIYANRQ